MEVLVTFRRILFVALAASATVAIGCGDEGGDGNTDTDTGADTGNPDISIGDTDSGGNTCESEVACERSTDCRNAGLDNYICGDDGCCIEDETTTLPECARHLAECESDEQTNDNFICDTTAGQCTSAATWRTRTRRVATRARPTATASTPA